MILFFRRKTRTYRNEIGIIDSLNIKRRLPIPYTRRKEMLSPKIPMPVSTIDESQVPQVPHSSLFETDSDGDG